MRRQVSNAGRRRAGSTLLEMVIGVTILAILAQMLIGASTASSAVTEVGNIEGEIFRQSERAMSRILGDLRRSGFVEVNGREYPHVFEAGEAGPGFEQHDHVPGQMAAAPGDADFGVMRSIVLCLPSDLDGDGRPELDADADGTPELDRNRDGVPTDDLLDVGRLWHPSLASIHPDTRLVWSHADVSYQVTATGPGGENELVRMVSSVAGRPRERQVLARGVERIQFDTSASSGFTIPGGTVRVRLFFRVRGSDGKVYRSRIESTVRLRNS
ncbi:MAG: hypothetical protein VX460_12445 [Planctomycetota bacterium]|nr:hypothetical protein [Planctomycetota bacterium]